MLRILKTLAHYLVTNDCFSVLFFEVHSLLHEKPTLYLSLICGPWADFSLPLSTRYTYDNKMKVLHIYQSFQESHGRYFTHFYRFMLFPFRL